MSDFPLTPIFDELLREWKDGHWRPEYPGAPVEANSSGETDEPV